MKISIDTPPYNARRYGKPWIARVDYTTSISKPEFIWGEWAGSHGSAGLLEIDVQPGDIVAKGQKDLRKNRGGAYYSQVQEDGTLLSLASPGEAVKAFRARATAASIA